MIGGTKLDLRNMNSIHKRLSLLFVLLYLQLKSGHSALITFPRDSEVLVNHSTYFNCSTSIISEQIHWYHYRVGENRTNYVYYKGQFNKIYDERYSIEINNKTGEYNLIIRSVKPEDAGRYECQDDVGLGNSSSAELIVLDSTPECLSNMKPDGVVGPNSCYLPLEKLQLSCSVSYDGNIPPILQWKMEGNDVQILRGIVTDYSGKRATVNLTTNSAVEMDGKYFTCGTSRSHEKQLSCATDAVNMHYEVSAKSEEACNCESYKNAVICIVVLLLIPLSIGVVTLTLMLIYNRRPKRIDFFLEFFPCMKKSQPKENDDITDNVVNNLEVSPKNEPPEEEPENIDERNKVEGDIEEDPEEADGQALLSSIPAEAIIASQEKELHASRKQIEQLKRTIKRHDTWNAKVINSLRARVKNLEQHLYSKETVCYAAKPSLESAIYLPGNNGLKPLSGITVLGNKLFAAIEDSQEIGVFNSETFQHERNMELKEMTNPLDIASSKKAGCLYIIYQVRNETESRVMRLDREGNVLVVWPSGGQTGRLSTYESNVVVCLFDEQSITEYSPKGEKITEVRLSLAAKLNHPLHALKVSGMHFVVSFSEGKDPLRRVCVVDLEGNIKASTKPDELKNSPKMNVPVCLAEDNERFIVVADQDTNRILLLSPRLEYKKNFLKVELQENDCPVRLCFDETNSKLFVAVNKWSNKKKNNHRILIFNVNSDSN